MMKAGCRYPRNPILIETARDYGFIEHLVPYKSFSASFGRK